MFKNAFIPYGGYYSSPFCKWQGSLANVNSIELGAATSKRWLASRDIDPALFDYLYLGVSVGQKAIFYGAPWAAAMLGAPGIPGQNVTQACATSTTAVFNAATAIETGSFGATYCLLADRTSNAPHTIWPNPTGPGGEVIAENWNMDNINADPATGKDMLTTAENVAREHGFTREQADELTLRRYEQYAEALADDRTFQKRYMFPVEVPVSRKETTLVEADEGVTMTSAEGLAKLRTVQPEGIHTFGSQTHPADGNAGIIVTTRERAAELSTDAGLVVQVLSYGHARAKPAHMPMAPASAAQKALDQAGLSIGQITTIKNHSPFIVNDLHLAKALGLDAAQFNNYGTSLVFGHPQGPTLGRLLIEAIEETALKGGGYALVTGCAAGDSAAALVVKVG
ncbi:thiolase family protein [Halomonas cerina]|uniref:Acetyl-CoA acetyltransferase family protein n=1 Tax=Halomonas cerina TaxID=447424 RepID=A0A839V932_9GAMM|nr:thiolase family protein [Halomonas cerina]MBB3191952.1 acetyl-CoA acetyltransferase family protein [Halomonas cerina]